MKTKLLSCLFLAVIISVYASGQTIKGMVTDSISGEVLVGATITSTQNNKEAVFTGLDGSFVIKGTTASGIKVSYIGYITKEVLLRNNIGTLSIQLVPHKKEMASITVTSGKNAERAARDMEKVSPYVMNVVSARAIEVSPDITVANVIQRVSGITVERNNTGDGQYALLRGMDKRYNYTLVNGVKIPSPDNKNRFVPLDIFPAEMLERLEVNKSLTPEMEGDGIGGAINLVMKDAPEKLQVSANIATGFNTLFFDRPFYSYDKLQIQKKSPYESIGSSYPAKPRDFNARLLDVKETSLRPNIHGGFSVGNRFLKNKLGVLLAGTYQNSLRGSNSTDFPYTTATSDASNLPVLTTVNHRTYSEEQIRAGVHAKLDYRINNSHKLQWYNAFMDFRAYQVRDERKTDLSVGYDPANNNYNLNYDRRFRYTHQQIINSTLKGEHSFLNNKLMVDWSAVYSRANNEVPDNSTVHVASTVRNGVENPKSVVVLGGAERRWEHNIDEDKAGYLNFRYHIATHQTPATISLGGMYRDKQRTNFFNEYQFRPYDDTKPAGSEKNLIEGTDWSRYSEIKFTVFNPLGSTGDPLNYSASEKVVAGYVQGKISTSKLELLTGLRVEHTEQGYFLEHTVAGLTNDSVQKYIDLLPSANLKFLLTAKSNLRVSYYQAINRPSFFEIVPYRIMNEDLTEAGNPELKHTVAHNVDIRYELFHRASEQFLIGAFYKKLIDPIEFSMKLQGQSSYYMPTNLGNATNYGLELDFIKFIYHFGLKLNYTYTNSSITTSKMFYYTNPDPTAPNTVLLKNVDQTRRLAGQAAHVANFTLLYKNTKKGMDAQLSMAYTGNRLYAVSKYLDNDLWQAGFVQVDASAEKRFARKYVVFLKAMNLLNTPVKLYLKKSNDATNSKAEGYQAFNNGTMTRNDEYGQTLLIGFRIKF